MDLKGFARIWAPRRAEPVGCGFLVSPKHVMTCTHVLKNVLGPTPKKGDGPIELDVLLDEQRREARTGQIVDSWPAQTDRRSDIDPCEDITLIELDQVMADEAVLCFFDPPNPKAIVGHKFYAFGHPNTHPDGAWADGIVKGWNRALRIQIDSESSMKVQSGFSGGAVFSENLQCFVGMVVAADLTPDAKTAFAIPTKNLLKAFPGLKLKKPDLNFEPDPDSDPDIAEKREAIRYDLLVHLCNREPNETEAEAALEKHVDAKTGRPFICVVQGPEEESVHRFVERLHDRSFVTKFPMKPRVVSLNWPGHYAAERRGVELIENFLRSKAQELKLSSATLDPVPLFIKTAILGGEFKGKSEELLQTYISFWRDYVLPTNRTVIVCLSARYEPERERSWRRLWLKQGSDRLKDAVRTITFTHESEGIVLTPLPPVEKTDAEDWPDEEEVKRVRSIPVDHVTAIYETRTPQWTYGGPIPMKLLAPHLEKLLKGQT